MPVAPWVRRSRSRTGAATKGAAVNGTAAQAGRSGALPARCPAGVEPTPAPQDAAAQDAAAPAPAAQDVPARAAANAGAEPEVDRGIRDMYEKQYVSLVRLAALLVGDAGAAEEVVQDCFVAMHGTWDGLADQDRALSYLHHAIVGRSRSARPAAPATAHPATADSATAHSAPAVRAASGADAWPVVISALSALPPLQREAIVLRFYLDLPGRETAAAMGISQDAAQAHTASGMAALQGVL